mgnify:CR=1 FL=1
MKVILTKDVAKVGRRGEVKELSPGFVHNMLLPNKLAVPATPENIQHFAKGKELEEKRIIEKKTLFSAQRDKLENEGISFVRKANKEGHLFAGLPASEIAEEVQAIYKLPLKAEDINLEHAIKAVGEHKISISYQGENADLKVVVSGKE